MINYSSVSWRYVGRLGIVGDKRGCFLPCMQEYINIYKYNYVIYLFCIYFDLFFCSCRVADTIGSSRTVPCSIWNGTSCWHEWRVNQSRGSLCQSAQYVTPDECCCCCSCCGCLWKVSYGRPYVACNLSRVSCGSLRRATCFI